MGFLFKNRALILYLIITLAVYALLGYPLIMTGEGMEGILVFFVIPIYSILSGIYQGIFNTNIVLFVCTTLIINTVTFTLSGPVSGLWPTCFPLFFIYAAIIIGFSYLTKFIIRHMQRSR